MSDTSLSRPHSHPFTPIRRVHEAMAAIPYWFTALVLRIPIAALFWRSGETKVDGWRLSSSAVDLFRSEYKLPLIDPTFAAYLSATAEHLFPVLLVIGLTAEAVAETVRASFGRDLTASDVDAAAAALCELARSARTGRSGEERADG